MGPENETPEVNNATASDDMYSLFDILAPSIVSVLLNYALETKFHERYIFGDIQKYHSKKNNLFF